MLVARHSDRSAGCSCGGLGNRQHSTEPAEIALLGLRFSAAARRMLLGYGALACLASLSRRAALWFTALAASLGLPWSSSLQRPHYYDAPGPMGFDLRDTLLYAVLAAYNIGSDDLAQRRRDRGACLGAAQTAAQG